MLVYAVLAHWSFGGGWLQERGTLDFAGGVPVEMGSGFSALAAALVVGARKDYGRQALLPAQRHLRPARRRAAVVRLVRLQRRQRLRRRRHRACSRSPTRCWRRPARCVVWFVLDLVRGRQVTAIGAATAIIVGCVGITPAAGYISPAWAMALGALAALPSYAVDRLAPAHARRRDARRARGARRRRASPGSSSSASSRSARGTGSPTGSLYGDAAPARRTRRWRCWRRRPTRSSATFVILRVIALFTPLRGDRARGGARAWTSSQHGEEAYATGEGAILISPDTGSELELAAVP